MILNIERKLFLDRVNIGRSIDCNFLSIDFCRIELRGGTYYLLQANIKLIYIVAHLLSQYKNLSDYELSISLWMINL